VKAEINLATDKVRARALEKAAKAENLEKEKAKVNLVAKVANAQLVMAQVWDQAPAQTKEAKAMAQALVTPKEEKVQKDRENPAKDKVRAKALEKVKVVKDRAKAKVKSAEIAMAQAVKPLSMTLLTTLEKKACQKLKRRRISKPLKISESNRKNVANNAKN